MSVAVRCPDGTRCARKLEASAPPAALFALVDASAWEGAPLEYALIASYPRRVATRAAAASGRTLSEAGLAGRQEAFFVELEEKSQPAPAAVESEAEAMQVA